MGVIITAGGASRRMGQDKRTLELGGTTLLLRAISTALTCSKAVVVVTDQVLPDLPAGVSQVHDIWPGAGPLGAVATGLESLPEGVHAVFACDMPYVTATVLTVLMELCDEKDAAVPIIDGRMEPLCAAYHSRSLPALRAEIESGERALHRALLKLEVRTVSELEIGRVDPLLRCLININTPDDYNIAKKGHET